MQITLHQVQHDILGLISATDQSSGLSDITYYAQDSDFTADLPNSLYGITTSGDTITVELDPLANEGDHYYFIKADSGTGDVAFLPETVDVGLYSQFLSYCQI